MIWSPSTITTNERVVNLVPQWIFLINSCEFDIVQCNQAREQNVFFFKILAYKVKTITD